MTDLDEQVDAFDVALTLILAVAGVLMAVMVVLYAARSDWDCAVMPVLCTLVAFGGIGALWARGGEGSNVTESAA